MLPGWSGAGRAADARPMTATSLPPTTAVRRPTEGRSPGRRFLAALDDRRLALAAGGPNWFASVMGTSIVATAAAGLPVRVPGLRPFAVVVWVLAGLLLTGVIAATVGHWIRHPQRARAHLDNPVMAQFYGAPPMALLAFGAATLLAGGDLIGARAALTRRRRRPVADRDGARAAGRRRRAVPAVHPVRRPP